MVVKICKRVKRPILEHRGRRLARRRREDWDCHRGSSLTRDAVNASINAATHGERLCLVLQLQTLNVARADELQQGQWESENHSDLSSAALLLNR